MKSAMSKLAWLALALPLVACDAVYDEFVEGDTDLGHVWSGRYEGRWHFEGDPAELAVFAGPEWTTIEFHPEDPPPGAWRGPLSLKMYQHDERTRTAGAIGRGRIIVDGHETIFWLRGNTFVDFELVAEPTDPLPGLTAQSRGSLGLMFEAKRDPDNDWLFISFGPNPDGSVYSFAYSRAE